jgi:L-fuconolactonase
MKIDAEIYFWKYENTFRHPLIRGNKILQLQWLPEQISQSLHRNGIDRCIAAVAENAEVQTRFLVELALTHPEISGVVGWLDLYNSKAADKILEFQEYTPIRGYRIETRNTQSILPSVMELLLANQYSLDLSLGAETDLSFLKTWLSGNQDQVFILRDCGNPDAKKPPSKTWETNIRGLAENQNLSCKLSGLFTNGKGKNWKPADFYPFLDILFDAFGSERLLFASEWPFLLLSGLYVQWKSLLEKFMEKYSVEDQNKIFGENARRLYRI